MKVIILSESKKKNHLTLTSYLKTSDVIEMVGEIKSSDHPERD